MAVFRIALNASVFAKKKSVFIRAIRVIRMLKCISANCSKLPLVNMFYQQQSIPSNHAAIFLDYENILYHLKNEYGDPPQVTDAIAEILRNLREYISAQFKLDVIIFKAYADFERTASALSSLYLMGIDTHNVLGTAHKNAADMRLCIDLMEVLYTRPDIQHFVLVAGDRDYIPIVQHLRRQARQVTAVAFRQTVSGDLLQILGKDNLLEADKFIKDPLRKELLMHKTKVVENMGLKVVGKIELPETKKEVPKPAAVAGTVGTKPAVPAAKKPARAYADHTEQVEFTNVKPLTGINVKECLELLLRFAVEKNVREVWLSPFLRFLTDEMTLLADYERKELINTMRIFGAVRVEKRSGETYDFSVIHINYNHPDVIRLMP